MYQVVPIPRALPSPEEILQQSLNGTLATAVEIGLGDRLAATVSRSHHQERLVDSDRLLDEVPVRVAAIIGGLPDRIRQAIASSMVWDGNHIIPVMELNEHEYPGPMPRGPYTVKSEELSPDNLRLAGRAVFELLEKAGLKPRLKYVFNWDIHRYWLAIAVEIDTPASPRPEHLR
ncbi:MAG: hypothetical protein IPM23_03990 [Candidatus Melainabacteria bacterium]|nr:hypothetical protein [Candidatus Melainabacteria bacterium]